MNGRDGARDLASAREGERVQAGREELEERLARAVPEDGAVEPLPGLEVRRISSPTELGHSVSDTVFCVVAQGCKEVLVGDTRYRYGAGDYLISSATLPVATRIVEASKERPYLRLRLKLDPALVGSVMVEVGYLRRGARPTRGPSTSARSTPA